jgi:hypothetical protein
MWDLRTLARLNEERSSYLKKAGKPDISVVATNKHVACTGEENEHQRRSDEHHRRS